MKMTNEVLNDGAFVVTRDENNILQLGFYHDVFNIDGSIERIFEPIGPVNIFSTKEIMDYIAEAK